MGEGERRRCRMEKKGRKKWTMDDGEPCAVRKARDDDAGKGEEKEKRKKEKEEKRRSGSGWCERTSEREDSSAARPT